MPKRSPSHPLLPWSSARAPARDATDRARDSATDGATDSATDSAPAPGGDGPDALPLRTAAEIAFVLAARAGRRVDVHFGRSRSLPVQLSRVGETYRLRLNAFFAQAPDTVVHALAAWVACGRRDRTALACLDTWIDEALDRLPAHRRQPPPLQPIGAVHDLRALSRDVRAAGWLDDLQRDPGVGWGQPRGRARHSLQLGLYDPDVDHVRIHPVLDHGSVPAWFVRSVLFHELLHAALPPRRDSTGRWIKHGPEFRRRERAHPDHARAQVWLADHIGRLIRAARRLPGTRR